MLEIRRITEPDIEAAATVLSFGMHQNPVNVAAMPNDTRRMAGLRRIFRAVMRGQLVKGRPLAAFDGATMVGVCGCFGPGQCQMAGPEKLKTLPLLLGAVGFGGTGRMLSWFGEWEKNDPPEPHWHLGPVAVLPDLQGKGVGSAMLNAFCEHADSENLMAYLETDKPVNVPFYRKFGFEVSKEGPVLGVPNWYMIRPSR